MAYDKINRMMIDAEENHKKVRIKLNTGESTCGVVDVYISRSDSDNGKSGVCFTTDNDCTPYIQEDEVESIVFV